MRAAQRLLARAGWSRTIGKKMALLLFLIKSNSGDEEKLQVWSRNVAGLDSALQQPESAAAPAPRHNDNNAPPRSANKSKKKTDNTAVKGYAKEKRECVC